jgi:hypothetical protein
MVFCMCRFQSAVVFPEGGVDPVGFCVFEPTASWLCMYCAAGLNGLSVLLVFVYVFCGFCGPV